MMLTKAEFWDEIEATFPEHFKQFSEWIDQWKIRNWLFSHDIKFHHLPDEMQSGVVFKFVREVFEVTVPLYDAGDELEVAQAIKDAFAATFVQDRLSDLMKDEP